MSRSAASTTVTRPPRADTDAIAAGAAGGRNVVVVGGGLLGLEAAAGVRARGGRVTVVEAADRLMPQQLDEGGARALSGALARLGIEARTACAVERIGPRALHLSSGEELPADVVVMAAGVRAETSLARAAGIEVERGVLVGDDLRTSAPGVWAVGECAEHRGVVHGLWAPAAEQARVAGASLCGDPAAFLGAVQATTLKVAGVDVFAGGRAMATGGQAEVLWSDGRVGAYRKLVLEPDGSLAGALLVGDAAGARELSALLRDGGAVPESVLGPPGPATSEPEGLPSRDALVCSCNAVQAGTILDAIRDRGLTTVEQVGASTRAGTGCGSCVRDLARLLEPDSRSRNTTVTDAKPRPARMPA